MYLSIGTEGRRFFRSKHTHFQIEKQPFKELWQAMEDSFTKVRNITYDCFVFYSCKQQKGESVKSFYGRLLELAENCTLGSEETTLDRDAFILNMIDHETQKELLKETVEPSKALEIAIQKEMGAQNQQKINQILMSGLSAVNLINNHQIRNRNANAQQTKRDFTRYATVPQNYQYTNTCMNCGFVGAIIINRFAPRMVKNAKIVASLAISQENVANRKSHKDKHKKPNKRTSIKLTSLPKRVMMKNLSITQQATNNCMNRCLTQTTTAIRMITWR